MAFTLELLEPRPVGLGSTEKMMSYRQTENDDDCCYCYYYYAVVSPTDVPHL